MTSEGRAIAIVCDQWLSEIFGHDVCKVVVDDELVKSGADELTTKIAGKPVFVYTKVPVECLCYVNFLEELGFRLVEANVVFEKQIAGAPDLASNCVLRFSEPGDEEQVTALAGRSFKYSRFHLDPLIPGEVANRVKTGWAANFFAGRRGQRMVIAEINDRIIGFAQLLFGKGGCLTIDLIAVDEGARRKGVGRDMISFAESGCEGFEKIRAGTQVANIASIRLYEKCGFMVVGANYVFHYHSTV